MKYIAVNEDYQEAFAATLEHLSKYKADEIAAIGTCVLFNDKQWVCFYWNCATVDKLAMSGILQVDAQDDLDDITHYNLKTDILTDLAEASEDDDETTDSDSL